MGQCCGTGEKKKIEVLGFALTYANLIIELSRMGILYPI